MKRTFNLLVPVTLLALTFGAVAVAPVKAAGPLNVLFIDDDKGTTLEPAWLSTLSALGITYSYEAIAADGNPASNLSNYNVVIWSNGDCAYSNLTAANVATLTAYLNGGGNLLYGGGHSVYEEPAASSFIQNYLGLSNFTYSMPMFQNNGLPVFADGTGNPITLNNLYSLNTFAGGCYGGNMFSSFTPGLQTAQSILSPRSTNLTLAGIPNEALAVFNDAPSFNTATWGFDLNNLDPQFRNQLLGDTLLALNGTLGTADISGTITNSLGGGAMSGITVANTGAPSTSTNGSGVYSFTGLAAGSYTITPSVYNYIFTPTSRTVNLVGVNANNQNFVGNYNAIPDINILRAMVVAANLSDTRLRTSLLAPIDTALNWLNGNDQNKFAYACSNIAKFVVTVRQNIAAAKLPAATGNPWIAAGNDILSLSGCATR